MVDYLNDFKMEQLISACESLYNSNKYDQLVTNLNDFSRLFRPDFFNKGSSIFKPLTLKKPLLSLIKFYGSSNKQVSDASKAVISHISPILSAINPIKFIETLKEIQKNSNIGVSLNYFFVLILPSISVALKTFDESTKMQSFSFLLSIFQNSQDYIGLPFLISSEISQGYSCEFFVNNIDDVSNDLCDIPISIISKYAPINELEKLVSLQSSLLDNQEGKSKPENLDLLSNPNQETVQPPVDPKKEAEIELFLQKKAILSARICNFRDEIIKIILSNTQELDINQRIIFLQYYIRFLDKKLIFSTNIAITLLDRIYLKLKTFLQPEFEPCLSVFTLIIDKYTKPIKEDDENEEEDQKDVKKKKKVPKTLSAVQGTDKVISDKLTMIIENLIDIIKKNKIKFSIFNKILNVLYKSARSDRSLINRDEVLPFIKNASSNPNDEYRLISLKIMFLFPDKGEVLNVLAPFLLTFHNFQTNVYSEYLSTLEENLNLIDDEMLTLIVNESVNPLPLLPQSAYSILSFLNAIPKRIFLKKNLNLNIYHLVDKYMLVNDSKVQFELAKFVQKVNISIRLSNPNFDFFSENPSSYLILNASSTAYSELNLNFLTEILEYRLVHPNNLIYALDYIQKVAQPPNYKKYFRTILNLLVCEVKLLGFNLPKLYKELNLTFSMANFNSNSNSTNVKEIKEGKDSKDNKENVEFDHLWLLNSDLVNMFNQIDLSVKFESSNFGKLLHKTLETINAIYQPSYESEVAILTSCTSSIFCSLSLDIIENRINKSTKELNEIIKILNDSSLPMSESVRISQFAVHCLNVKTSLSMFLPYLREGAEQSREIADYFSLHSSPQSLTKPIPTFLSFVDPSDDNPEGLKNSLFKKVSDSKTAMSKWNNYVDLCQQVIEPENWVIMKGDKERIMKLTNYKNGFIERALKLIPEEKKENTSASSSQENFLNKKNIDPDAIGIFEIDEREMHFILEKKWQKEESLYELTMFLWHSSGIKEKIDPEMLSEIDQPNIHENEVIGGIQKKFKTDRKGLQYMSYMEIEEIALNGADKDSFLDLLIGFFNYSAVNHIEIQVKRWLDVLQVTKYDKKHILMIALFFENVHCKFNKLPRQISILAQNALTSFGYPLMTKPLLILAYLQLTGIRWFLVRSIIGIDPEFFKEFPIIAFDFNIKTNNPPKQPNDEDSEEYDTEYEIDKSKTKEKTKTPTKTQSKSKEKAKDKNKDKTKDDKSKDKTKDDKNKDKTKDDKNKDKTKDDKTKDDKTKDDNKDSDKPKDDNNDTDKTKDDNVNKNVDGDKNDAVDENAIMNKKKNKKHEFMISSGSSLTLFDYYVSLSQTVFDPNNSTANFDLDYFYYKNDKEHDYFYNYDSGMEFINNEMSISPPWSIPTNRKWPSKMKTFLHSHVKVGYSNMIELSDTVFKDIMKKLRMKKGHFNINNEKKQKESDNDQIDYSNNTIPEIFYILMNTDLTSKQRKIVQEVFLTQKKTNNKEESSLLLIKSLENDNNNDDSLLYDRSIRKYYAPRLLTIKNLEINNPMNSNNNQFMFKSNPSLTLKTFRTLLCQFAKPVQQSMIHDFVKKQSPVHPSCCYEKFAKQGIRVWIPKKEKYQSPTCCANFELDYATFKNSALDNSRAGLFDPTILSLLKVVSDEAVSTLLFLFSLDERDLIQLKETEIGSIDVVKTDILRTVFETVSNKPESNIYFAAKIMKAIKILLMNKIILIDDLSTLICNREFLTSSNFLPTAFVFLSLEKIAKKLNRDDIVSFCKMLKSEEADIFEKDEAWKKKFFADSTNPSVIIETFHHG